jgi:hypothetical protein
MEKQLKLVLKYNPETKLFVGKLNKSRLQQAAQADYHKDRAKKQSQITQQGKTISETT